MIKYENFNEFYSNMNIENNKILDDWKRIKMRKRKVSICILTIIVLLDLLAVWIIHKISLFIIVEIFIIDIFVYIILQILFDNKQVSEFNIEYKEKVIEKLLENFIEELDYIPQKSMPNSIFDEVHYGGNYNKYYSDDYIEGKIKEQKIIMSDILVQREEKTINPNGNEAIQIITIFDGLFAKINLKKSINSTLNIIRDYGITLPTNQKLEMDSSEFEKKFNVYSNNEIIGMQLLTPDVQEDILYLYNKYNINFNIYIFENRMYVLFNTGNMFEIFSTKNNPIKMLERYFEIMKFIHNLVEKIIMTIEETQI